MSTFERMREGRDRGRGGRRGEAVRAIVQDRYGPPERVLALRELPAPEPGEREALVRVRAASVHPDVWHVVTGRPYALRLMGAGLRHPRRPVPGTDLAGRVEAVGPGVTRVRPGDEVIAETVRGHQWTNGGAFAELACVRESALEPAPARLTPEQAAALPTSGLIALRVVREEGRVRPGHRVLVNGAGGGVGTLAVQIARADGAHVTAVDAPGKLDMLRRIGAERVIDHTCQDFTRLGERWDVVIDVASTRTFSECRRALSPDGTYVLVGHDHFGRTTGRWLGSLPRAFGLVARSPFTRQLAVPRRGAPRRPIAVLAELAASGAVTPVVDRAFPLEETVEAIRYLGEESVLGKLVVLP